MKKNEGQKSRDTVPLTTRIFAIRMGHLLKKLLISNKRNLIYAISSLHEYFFFQMLVDCF
jgi:hypothetical protein